METQRYVVIEIQTNAEGMTAALPTAYDDQPTALQKYHTVLAYAAVSALPTHGALLLDLQNPLGPEAGLAVEQKLFRRDTNSSGEVSEA